MTKPGNGCERAIMSRTKVTKCQAVAAKEVDVIKVKQRLESLHFTVYTTRSLTR